MSLDLSKVGASTEPYEIAWTTKDTNLYALAVGAGIEDLEYTTDNTAGLIPRTLPTMPTILTRDAAALKLLGEIDWRGLVHAEQQVQLPAPLPVRGEGYAVSRIESVQDKGSAALVTIVSTVHDREDESPLFTTTSRMFLRGQGGFGGERGESEAAKIPEREPDVVVRDNTRAEQALLYRLCGDRNRLHSDPAVAARAGFERPILHGLCTYAFAGRALLTAVCDGDPVRFESMRARFTAPVTPGDELITRIWEDGANAYFQTLRTDGTVVIDGGYLTTGKNRTDAT